MSFPFMDVCDVRQEVFPVRQNHSIGLIANSAWPCVHCESGIRASLGDLCGQVAERMTLSARIYNPPPTKDQGHFLGFPVGNDVR